MENIVSNMPETSAEPFATAILMGCALCGQSEKGYPIKALDGRIAHVREGPFAGAVLRALVWTGLASHNDVT